MINLLYKEIKLAIPIFFWILPVLTGALLMIPQWIFSIAFFYFFWITIPQILSNISINNDLEFSLLMPINKKSYVKSKILTISIIGLVHILIGMIVSIIHVLVYKTPNFAFDLNFAFFGIIFIIYGIFNLVLFPMYFKTGYKFGIPIIIANIVVFLIAGCIETLNILYPSINNIFEGTSSTMKLCQFIILIIGILLYILSNYLAYKISSDRFECVDL